MLNRKNIIVARLLFATFVAFAIASSTPAAAQDGLESGLFPKLDMGRFGTANKTTEPVKWKATYFANPSGKGEIEIEAELAPTWHIYSTTQKPGGPLPTRFKITSPADVKITGEFTPDLPPTKSVSSVYKGVTVEEHEELVVWTAPITLPFGFDEAITISVNALACESVDGSCLPVNAKLVAQYGGPQYEGALGEEALGNDKFASPAVAMVAKETKQWFRDKDYVVQWSASLSPKQVVPGGNATLTFTAKPDKTFHVYREAIDDAESSTNFVVTDKASLKIGGPESNESVISKSIIPTMPPLHYYPGEVTWTLPIVVPKDATAGDKTITGFIAYQACTDNSCHRPVALEFATTLTVAQVPAAGSQDVAMKSAKSSTVLDAAAETKWVDKVARQPVAPEPSDGAALPIMGSGDGDSGNGDSGNGGSGSGNAKPNLDSEIVSSSATSFPIILCLAFIGGVILNVMPCVLPVVGLKIMGFVSQAGEDRRRILLLNIAYALGIMVVFAGLAMLAIVFKFGWGQQFTYFPVRLGLTLLLFALALSYLGVWEIPAPGMASSKTSQKMQSREGLAGAFSKGMFATVLATPCSGPMLGYILGLTLGLSSLQTGAIFMAVGLGMALPYLLIGLQPRLIAWLPKPGNWMETFKQLMSFLFLGTVAFFFAQFQDEQKVPVFVSIIGVWFGCWIIGQVPGWAELPKRLMAWTGGIAVASIISIGAFHYLVPGPKVLAWEDYNEVRLQKLHSEGKTVLLDFSAKWCINCIYNYEVAINTEKTRKLVDELGAVAMYADYTDFDEEIQQKLEELQSRSIPLLAIYPGRAPNDPIILRDIVTQKAVLDALQRAGQSVDGSKVATAQTGSSASTTK